MFQGAVLSSPIKAQVPVFTGATLNGDQPCQLLHAVSRCAPASATGTESERMRVNSSRFPSPTELSLMHDKLLEDAKEEVLHEPYPNKCVRPRMAFLPSDLKATGPLQGIVFKRHKNTDVGGTGTVWLIAQCERTTKANRRMWRAKAKRQMLTRLTTDKLPCVSCNERDIDSFLLCSECETAPTAVPRDLSKYLDFTQSKFNPPHRKRGARGQRRTKSSNNRKDHGFQDAASYDKNSSLLPDYQYISPSEPYTDLERPLLEHELVWILAVKYPGFTRPGSLEYKKAQRAAAQLAGHFIFKRTFAEVARTVPTTTEESVRKLCLRAREDYWRSYVRSGRMPVEAVAAMTTGMLRHLYYPSLTDGHFCRSRGCCAA